MGMFRDTESFEADLVKEMAEALGSSGLRLEYILEQLQTAAAEIGDMLSAYNGGARDGRRPDIAHINARISDHNKLVEKAEEALRWLLIQREACGFRTHRHVNVYYPIPSRIKLIQE
jgi:hypothetical protein